MWRKRSEKEVIVERGGIERMAEKVEREIVKDGREYME